MKAKPWVAVSDNHGDMVDKDTAKALKSFIKDFNPTIRIHLGDNWDFRALRKGASEDEEIEDLDKDWLAGEKFVQSFFDGGVENYFLCGNHDARLWDLAGSLTASGPARGFAKHMIEDFERLMKESNVKTVLPYDSRLGVLQLGHLKCIHGYHAGESAARQHARIYGNVIFGHTHCIENATAHSYDEPREARGIGACCTLDMGYNARQTNKLRHSNGWAYGYLFDDGTYQINQTRKVGGRFHAASSFKVY